MSTSLFDAFVTRASEVIAERQHLPAETCVAFRQTLEHILREQAASVFGGERVYAPKVSSAQRQQSRQRILHSIASGEPTKDIARRERVSAQWVRRLRETIRP